MGTKPLPGKVCLQSLPRSNASIGDTTLLLKVITSSRLLEFSSLVGENPSPSANVFQSENGIPPGQTAGGSDLQT